MAPIGFRWIIPELLAGSGRPGLFSDLEQDLGELARLGLRTIVTLTETPLAVEPGTGFQWLHFPIDDMGVPQARRTLSACLQVLEQLGGGERVLLHCKAGLGRTGTIAAAILVTAGWSAGEAIEIVRRGSPGSIQTDAQLAFVRHYEAFCRDQRPPVSPALRARLLTAIGQRGIVAGRAG